MRGAEGGGGGGGGGGGAKSCRERGLMKSVRVHWGRLQG